jgi:anthranilate phosphoribosyltransferase
MITEAIAAVVEGRALDAEAMNAAMEEILGGEATPSQIAAFAIALRMRGETAEELTVAARALRRHCAPLALGGPLLDTCGTGGDGAGTFNISTVSAIVVAACGVRVAKHGNRAVSSKCGSADVLEALGVKLDAPGTLDTLGITFLFAPAFHGALKHAAPVRRELGLRTFFNLLGPLANPASASHQLLGVYDPRRVRQIAEVLGRLGSTAAWVVHGGGLDEISPCGPTNVAMLREGSIDERTIEPRDFGVAPVPIDEIAGGDPAANADIARRVLAGHHDAARTAVVINAAAALAVMGERDLDAAARRAERAIDSGAASSLLERWRAAC